MKFNRGDVVFIPFPYTDLTASKVRPVAIINTPEYQEIDGDLLVLFLTSKISQPHPKFDYLLVDWKAAGLKKPTLMRSKLAVINESLVERKIGSLSRDDTAGIEQASAQALNLSRQ